MPVHGRVTAREPPGQPCNGGRQHVLSAGPQVAQAAGTLQLVCVRLLPRRACSNQVSKTVAGPKDHTGSLGARPVGHQRSAGRRHRSPVGRYRRSAAEPSIGRRQAVTSRVMAATRVSTMATNCRKQGKTRMGLINSDHGPGSLSSRRPADETPTKPAYRLGQPSPGTRAPRVSSSRAAGRPGGRAINGPPPPGGFQVLHSIRKCSLIHHLSSTVAG